MRPASHAEGTEGPCGGHPCHADAVDDRRRRPIAQPIEERLKLLSRTLGDAPDGSVPLVRDPALEPDLHRLAKDEVAKADPMDAPDDGGVEASE